MAGLASARSVFVGQEDRGRGTVGLGDNPEFHAAGVIHREEAAAVDQSVFVGLAVGVADIAPVASHVAAESVADIDGGELLEHAARGHDLTDGELVSHVVGKVG